MEPKSYAPYLILEFVLGLANHLPGLIGQAL